ncbi:MAG: peroxide stress protein YaaA [Clostridia bacterium]
MKIIISPAKKMNIDTDSFEVFSMPKFIEKTTQIKEVLQHMSDDELQKLWKCNSEIAKLNIKRLENMDLNKNLTPAILAYQGIQYQHLAANILTFGGLDYIKNHLCILSAFYGVLNPFDGVVPYRLEMQAKLEVNDHKNLYSFWGEDILPALKSDTILNLASKEYSKAVEPYIKNQKFITCSFAQRKEGKLVEKATMCKMARGSMVRFLAENNITKIEDVKEFNLMNFKYSKENSTNEKYVFLAN